MLHSIPQIVWNCSIQYLKATCLANTRVRTAIPRNWAKVATVLRRCYRISQVFATETLPLVPFDGQSVAIGSTASWFLKCFWSLNSKTPEPLQFFLHCFPCWRYLAFHLMTQHDLCLQAAAPRRSASMQIVRRVSTSPPRASQVPKDVRLVLNEENDGMIWNYSGWRNLSTSSILSPSDCPKDATVRSAESLKPQLIFFRRCDQPIEYITAISRSWSSLISHVSAVEMSVRNLAVSPWNTHFRPNTTFIYIYNIQYHVLFSVYHRKSQATSERLCYIQLDAGTSPSSQRFRAKWAACQHVAAAHEQGAEAECIGCVATIESRFVSSTEHESILVTVFSCNITFILAPVTSPPMCLLFLGSRFSCKYINSYID